MVKKLLVISAHIQNWVRNVFTCVDSWTTRLSWWITTQKLSAPITTCVTDCILRNCHLRLAAYLTYLCPLLSDGRHLSNDDRLEDKIIRIALHCKLWATFVHNGTCTHTHTHSWAVLRDDRWFRFEFHFRMFFAFFFTEPVSCCWLSLVDSPSAIECWQRIISGNYLYVE